jgi:hemerythrin-like domain-containing protein
MNEKDNTRRGFLMTAAAGSALILNACVGNRPQPAGEQTAKPAVGEKKEGAEGEKEVTAGEDLMREHGVLRRALLVYTEAAVRLRRDPGSMPPDTLTKTAKLFRSFGEDYHEKKLEEAFIFPAVKQKGGAAASYPDILVVQHDRGREITDYVLSVTQGAKLGANATALADVLEGFVRMYRHHAAREDTVVFPAWKEAVSEEQYKELSEKFEEIEHEQFGADGFDDAVKQIGEIEGSLNLSDLARFTPPAPPSK